jgi:NAD(P)-dependent dehydrogenase (short-subunit alcohol dehydrogenase family)
MAPNPTYDFSGQVALVTRAGSGVGLATAREFAEAGAAVVLADINDAAVQAATDDLTAAGHQVLGVTCDVSDEASVGGAVGSAVETFGRLDTAFNNAGIQVPVAMPPTSRPMCSTVSMGSTFAACGRA